MTLSKECSKCGQKKNLTDYYKQRHKYKGKTQQYGDGHMSICKECHKQMISARSSTRRRELADKARMYALRRFGLTVDKYEELLLAQKGVCAICGLAELSTFRGEIRRLAVDHDHETNRVRGLLCLSCNSKLGWFELQELNIKNYLNGTNKFPTL